MHTPLRDLGELLRSLAPRLNPGVYAFATIAPAARATADAVAALEPLATFREAEGLSVIVTAERAREAGLAIAYSAAWITLDVRSDLHAVGMTAAVAEVLARAGISCNVVAATQHDHVFVPSERAEQALDVLRGLQHDP